MRTTGKGFEERTVEIAGTNVFPLTDVHIRCTSRKILFGEVLRTPAPECEM